MDLDSVLEDVLRSRGQGNLILKPRQKEALQSIVFKGQDCLIVLPTGYGKSLIYQMLPGGGGYFRNFWVGMCRWDPGTLNLY